MVLTYIEKIGHSMCYVTGVYLRDITQVFFQMLHLNVSHLSICSSCKLIFFLFYLFYEPVRERPTFFDRSSEKTSFNPYIYTWY